MKKWMDSMRALVLAILLMPCFGAMAANSSEPKPLEISDIVEQQKQIRADVTAGKGRYASMSRAQRSNLLAAQSEILSIIGDKDSVDDLSDQQRREVFNKLETIQAAVNNEESDRMICRREKTIGSNRVTRVCRTAEAEQLYREEARDRMLEGDPMGRS